MKALLFYVSWFLISLITLLPLRVMYLFSDFLFLLLYYFPGYRKNVVMTNLRNAFPEKPENELRQISKKFYRHLSDLFVEVFKLHNISSGELMRRCRVQNPEVLERLHSEGKDIVAVLGHYNNWEMLITLPLICKYTCISVYRPLKNKYFDRYMCRLRSEYGMVLTPMSHVVRDIIMHRNKGEKVMVCLLADQTPARSEIHYRTLFLNQDTPVYLGTEKIASKYNMAIVFSNHRKIKRGYYSTEIEVLYEQTSDRPEYEITETHVKKLDKLIREAPEYWLWSHRRWKY